MVVTCLWGLRGRFILHRGSSEYKCSLAKEMGGSALFNNGTGPLVVDVARPLSIQHWVYVDNLGLICLD